MNMLSTHALYLCYETGVSRGRIGADKTIYCRLSNLIRIYL